MNIGEIKENLRISKNTGWDPEKSTYENDVSYLLSIIEQQDKLLNEWWIMFVELGQTTRDSFHNDKDFGEFVKLAMSTKHALQAIRGK